MMKTVSKKSKKKYMKLNVKSWHLFLLGFIILIIPLIISGFSVKGYEPFLYERLADIVGNDFDELSYGGRGFAYNYGNPILLNLLSFIPLNIVLLILPVLFGLLSLILFYNILKDLGVYYDIRIISSLILVISPPFLYSFTNFNYFTVPVFLILLGFWLFLKDKLRFYVLSLFTSFLLAFFGIFNSLVFLLILFLYSIKKKKLNLFLIFFVCNLVLLAFLNFLIIMNYGFPENVTLGGILLRNLIFDLGGGYGISLFLIFFLFFGFTKLWEKKYKNSLFYFIFGLFILLLFFSLKTMIYFNLFLCVLAAMGFLKILNRKWESNLIRNLTLFFLIIGLIFSCVSFFGEFSKVGPSEGLKDALSYLNGKSGNVVLSHYNYGFWINSIADKKNVVDGYFDYAPNVNDRLNEIDHLFNTRSMNKVLEITEKYNVDYILITDEMKKGLVWYKDNDGLLYLLKNNPNFFKKIYDENEIEIWRIL